MLVKIYSQLLIMSFVSGCLYLFLKIIRRRTLKIYSNTWHYYTYFLIFTFFLIPYQFIFSWLDFNFLIQRENGSALPVVGRFVLQNAELSQKQNGTESFNYIILMLYVWMSGTIIFIGIHLIKSFCIYRRIHAVCRLADDNVRVFKILGLCKQKIGIKKEIKIYNTVHISTPFLFGILKPKVVLPNIEFSDEELYCILFHELMHWKRHDIWLKCFMFFINAMHWFNPFAYVIRQDINRLCELSCDESVVKNLTIQERRRYCELILSVLSNLVVGMNSLSAFSSQGKNLERRIEFILEAQKNKSRKWVSVLAVSMSLILMTAGAITVHAATSGKDGAGNCVKQIAFIDEKGRISINNKRNESSYRKLDIAGYVSIGSTNRTSSIVKNGSIIIYTNDNKKWSLKKGDKLNLNFEFVNHFTDGQSLQIGYIFNEKFQDIFTDKTYKDVALEFVAPEDGEYGFYLIGNSSDTVAVKAVSIK